MEKYGEELIKKFNKNYEEEQKKENKIEALKKNKKKIREQLEIIGFGIVQKIYANNSLDGNEINKSKYDNTIATKKITENNKKNTKKIREFIDYILGIKKYEKNITIFSNYVKQRGQYANIYGIELSELYYFILKKEELDSLATFSEKLEQAMFKHHNKIEDELDIRNFIKSSKLIKNIICKTKIRNMDRLVKKYNYGSKNFKKELEKIFEIEIYKWRLEKISPIDIEELNKNYDFTKNLKMKKLKETKVLRYCLKAFENGVSNYIEGSISIFKEDDIAIERLKSIKKTYEEFYKELKKELKKEEEKSLRSWEKKLEESEKGSEFLKMKFYDFLELDSILSFIKSANDEYKKSHFQNYKIDKSEDDILKKYRDGKIKEEQLKQILNEVNRVDNFLDRIRKIEIFFQNILTDGGYNLDYKNLNHIKAAYQVCYGENNKYRTIFRNLIKIFKEEKIDLSLANKGYKSTETIINAIKNQYSMNCNFSARKKYCIELNELLYKILELVVNLYILDTTSSNEWINSFKLLILRIQKIDNNRIYEDRRRELNLLKREEKLKSTENFCVV